MSSSVVKIDSPFAKIGIGGQVTCTLCNAPVKSAKVWIAHVNGRQHRENLSARSAKKPPSAQGQPAQNSTVVKADNAGLKRPAPSNGSNANDVSKKAKTMSASQKTQSVSVAVSKSTMAPTRSLVTAASGSESESDEDSDSLSKPKKEGPSVKPEPAPAPSGLPADFFDAGTSSLEEQKPGKIDTGKSAGPKQADPTEAKPGELPEGFFDDRKKDAKVRGVELKDPLDDEWGKFQKEMQKVDVVSEQIVEEDEEEMALARDLDEVGEQMREWSRINELEKRKDTLVAPKTEDGSTAMETSDQSSGTDDEADDTSLENVLDWRSKGVWK